MKIGKMVPSFLMTPKLRSRAYRVEGEHWPLQTDLHTQAQYTPEPTPTQTSTQYGTFIYMISVHQEYESSPLQMEPILPE